MTAPIVRAIFFAHVRASGLCGPSLSQVEVDGLTGILDAWERLGWPPDLRHVAYTLATAWHECRLNLALREDGHGRGHQYGVPINGRAYYGRGAGQLTWLDNYRTFGRLLGLDLVGNPDLALVPETSAAILIIGARDGLFRHGRTLARFFNAQTDDPVGARDIINGDMAKNGTLIAGYHRIFLACLTAAVSPEAPVPSAATPSPAPKPWWPRLRDAIRHNMHKGI
ncbi:glycoside hydrolase family 19 protein [Methylobacterium brachiatum]|uniref:glycoside hydrolase family 19 protein n=1 Tax=Methylobacterium brachiatum TaxID=269660 RepID=UPI000EFD1649|nr:glycoside hydrolase family 19 protein [Methylobacterium brachiatum]AYO81573.1 hypothetical protein EBB05_04295 [Methylobacterium brachiatum]